MIEIEVDDEITLRQFDIGHAEALFALVDSDRAHLRKWLPWVDATKTVEDSKIFIGKGLEQDKAGKGYHCGIWYRGGMTGVIGLHHLDRSHRKSSLGYWLHRDHEGKGIVTRATRAMIDHLIRKEKMNRIEIGCAVENTKSRAIPERLGAREEGVRRQVEWRSDHFVDHVIYSVLAEEWEER